MRCRKLQEIVVDDITHHNVVWFGSAGIIEDGLAEFYFTLKSFDILQCSYSSKELKDTKFKKISDDNNVYIYKNNTPIYIIEESRNDYETIEIDLNNNTVKILIDGGIQAIMYYFNIDTSKANNGIDYENHIIYIINSGSSVLTYEGYIQIFNAKIEPEKRENEKDINYSEQQYAVQDSLIQRLSVLKKELWYRASYGLPLFDKIRNKGILDAIIIDIITSHIDVTTLLTFESTFDQRKREYIFTFSVLTRYTPEEVIINLTINK